MVPLLLGIVIYLGKTIKEVSFYFQMLKKQVKQTHSP